MTTCGFDADSLLSGLGVEARDVDRARVEAHLRDCTACRAAVGVHALARRTWSAAIARDDAYAKGYRELRLSAPRRARASALGALVYLALGAAIALLSVDLLSRRGAPLSAPSSAGAAAPIPTASPVPPAIGAGVAASPARPATAPADAPVHLHALRGCPGCARTTDGPVTAGAVLASAVDVPRGTTLLLGWGLFGDAIDATSGVDVVGPARVHAAADASAAVVLDRGVAIVDTRPRGEVRTAVVRTFGADASWRVEVQGDRTRVEVLRGIVSVESGNGAVRLLSVGESVVVEAPAALPTTHDDTAAPAPPPPASADPASAALALPLPSPAGAYDGGAAAAFDRMSRAALAAGANRERAAVWRAYLATTPPSPHAEVAMAELANILLDLGSPVEARVVVAALDARPAVPEATPGLDRAHGRLLSLAASECLAHDMRAICGDGGSDRK